MTKLSSGLPKEYEDDGLASINRDLITDPHTARVVIMLVDCKAVTTDMDKGLEIATARILHIEPITDPDKEARARDLLLDAQEQRTGRRPLPLGVDKGTGEVLRTGTGIHIVNGANL